MTTKSKTAPSKGDRTITITAPNFQFATFRIAGNAPYVQLAFSQKAREALRAGMEKPKTGKKKVLPPRNFDDDYENAKHISEDGWPGIPAGAFRMAMVSACRLVPGVTMTLAKLVVFIEADGFDNEGYPLVKLDGTPEKHISHVRNATGVVDLRARAMYKKWTSDVTVKWDADQFGEEDITNLMMRVGQQVGIGEGRPDSRKSAGMGWGTFDIEKIQKST